MQEDFRHVGIGTILMKEIIKNEGDIGFNSSKFDSIHIAETELNFFLVSYLLPTTERFKLEAKSMRTFGRIRVKNPSGFASLKVFSEIKMFQINVNTFRKTNLESQLYLERS